MNISKTKLRNGLNIETLNSIVAVKFGLKRVRKCSYEYKLPETVISEIETLECYKDTEPRPSFEHTEEIY